MADTQYKKITPLNLIDSSESLKSADTLPIICDNTASQVSLETIGMYLNKNVPLTNTKNEFSVEQFFKNNVSVYGNLIVDGDIISRGINHEIVSSSITYYTGSTKFGDNDIDEHRFRGNIILNDINLIDFLYKSEQTDNVLNLYASSLDSCFKIIDNDIYFTGSINSNSLNISGNTVLNNDVIISGSLKVFGEIEGVTNNSLINGGSSGSVMIGTKDENDLSLISNDKIRLIIDEYGKFGFNTKPETDFHIFANTLLFESDNELNTFQLNGINGDSIIENDNGILKLNESVLINSKQNLENHYHAVNIFSKNDYVLKLSTETGSIGFNIIDSQLLIESDKPTSFLFKTNDLTPLIISSSGLVNINELANINLTDNGVIRSNGSTSITMTGGNTIENGAGLSLCGNQSEITPGKLRLWSGIDSDIAFATNNIDRVLINKYGNIGIGTNDAQSKIDILNTNKNAIKIKTGDDNASVFNLGVDIDTKTVIFNTNSVGDAETYPIHIKTNDTKRLSIGVEGNIQIGNDTESSVSINGSIRYSTRLVTENTKISSNGDYYLIFKPLIPIYAELPSAYSNNGLTYVFKNTSTIHSVTINTKSNETIESQPYYIVKPGNTVTIFSDGYNTWYII